MRQSNLKLKVCVRICGWGTSKRIQDVRSLLQRLKIELDEKYKTCGMKEKDLKESVDALRSNVSGVQVIAKGNTMDVQNLSREVDEAQTEVTLVVEYVGDSLQDRKGSGTVYKRLMSLRSQLKMTRTNWTT